MDIHHPGTNQMLFLYEQLGFKFSSKTTCMRQCYASTPFVYAHTDWIFGQGSGLALQIPAGCAGNEASLLQCPPQDYKYYYYGYHYYYTYYYYTGLYYSTCSDHVYDIGDRCTPGMCR